MRKRDAKRVVVCMSGGVDSSVAAALLKERGYDVIGVSMQVWDYSGEREEEGRTCCSPDDIYHARSVADKLNIPFYVLNLEDTFEKVVVDYFVSEYMHGRTPNPCILCNQKLKFQVVLRKAMEFQAEYLATGHHARIVWDHSRERYTLLKGVDGNKDQSYFLFTLKQDEMRRILFPVGDFEKAEIRRIAKDRGLNTADKKESQEICFIRDNDYRGFISNRVGMEICNDGNIVNRDGDVLGKHEGIHMYTVGQRKGIGVPAPHPYYVLGCDSEKNTVIVGKKDDLLCNGLIAEDLNWIVFESLESVMTVTCKIRYRYTPAEATLLPRDSNSVQVIFSEPQRAVAPGQAVVFYDGDAVIGGGWIKEST